MRYSELLTESSIDDDEALDPRDEAKQDLWIALVQRLGQPHGVGRHRAGFRRGQLIIKYPLNPAGERDNEREAALWRQRSSLSYPVARCRLYRINDIPLLVMEYLTPVSHHERPDWWDKIDLGALGQNMGRKQSGEIAAYDYADDDSLAESAATRPQFLYHVTSDRYLPSIEQHGLVPQLCKDAEFYGEKRSALYLGTWDTCIDHAEVVADRAKGNVVYFRVAVSNLDLSALEPDDYDIRMYMADGEFADPRLEQFKHWSDIPWDLSLAICGACVYTKAIPFSALRRVTV